MIKQFRFVFLLLFALFFYQPSTASLFNFSKSLQVDKENKNLKINTLLQDHQGFIWVGTDHGLYVYDGYDFDKIIADSANHKSSVVTLFQEKNQTIWVGTETGEVYRKKADKFKLIPSPIKSAIKSFINYSSDEIWVATYGDGIYSFKNEEWKKVNTGDVQFFYAMVLAPNGNVLAGTDMGLMNFSSNKKYKLLNTKNRLPENIVRDIKVIDNSKVVLGFEEAGICFMDLKTNSFIKPNEFSNWNSGAINQINYNNNACWISTEKNGLVSFSTLKNGKFKFYNTNNGIAGTKINFTLFDREGNMWIAADNKLFINASKKIEVIKNNTLSFNDAQALVSDPEGYIWFSNKKGLFKYDPSKTDSNSVQKINMQGITNLHIVSLYLDDWGFLWIGTFDNGLFRLNTYNNEVKKFGSKDGLMNANIVSIKGKDNKIWLATLGGIAECTILEDKVNPGNLSYRFNSLGGKNSPGEIFVYDVFIDSRKRVWFGTDGKGLSCLENGVYSNYNNVDKDNNLVVYSITEDKKGNIWFSTLNHGLYRYDGSKFSHLGVKEGLRDNEIAGIITDWQGNIVVVHSKGIDKVNPVTLEIEYIGEESGIDKLDCNINAITKDDNGNVWIGSQDGLIKLVKSRYSDVTKPLTSIRKIYTFMKPGLSARDSIFEYNQNQISIEFIGLWYANPDAVHYRYRLVGFSNQWIPTKDKIVTFPNLPPGNYTFELEASVNNRFINPSFANYSFKVKKPITKQWWFITLIILLSAGGLIWFIRDRDVRFRNMEAMKKEKMEYQYETLKSQINPHFLFNSFNTLITIIEDNQDKAVDYVETLSDYFRSMLNYRDKDTISLSDELEIVNAYFYLQQKRFGDYLKLNISVSENLKNNFSVPPLSIQLLVENAIKHNAVSHETPLMIEIKISDDNQLLIVSNNLNPKKNHDPSTGIGLNNIFSRYKILTEKDVTVIRTDKQFIVELPLIKNST